MGYSRQIRVPAEGLGFLLLQLWSTLGGSGEIRRPVLNKLPPYSASTYAWGRDGLGGGHCPGKIPTAGPLEGQPALRASSETANILLQPQSKHSYSAILVDSESKTGEAQSF